VKHLLEMYLSTLLAIEKLDKHEMLKNAFMSCFSFHVDL